MIFNFISKSKLAVTLLSLCVLLLLTLIAASAEEKIVWKLGGVHAVGTPETLAQEKLSELIKNRTNGLFIVDVYPASQLGAAVPQLQNLKINAQQMFVNVSDWLSHIERDWNIMAMPFAFSNLEHIKAFQKTKIYKELGQTMLKDQIRLLADNWYRLPKVLLSKRPVFRLEDIQGMKLRMPQIATYYKTWRALGAKPTVVPWAEAYMALKTGTVDGMDSPLSAIYGQKFYEAAPYITVTNHLIAPVAVLVNERAYQSLPSNYQAILKEAATEAGEYYTALVEEKFVKDKETMLKKGAVFIEIDTTSFKEKAREVAAKEFEGDLWSEGLFDQVDSIRP